MWILDALEEKKSHEAKAIINREEAISWKDLWEESEKLSVFLDHQLLTKNPIIIYGNKDIEINIAMLAALKSGRAYVPVDITYPLGRLKQIAKMTSAELIINLTGLEITEFEGLVYSKEEIQEIIQGEELARSDKSKWVKKEDNCYILFTSGSTGQPKGVPITRGNIESFIASFGAWCKLEHGSVALNQVSYSFDVSVIQLYIYLSQGVTLFNIDKAMMDNFNELFQYLEKSEIAVWVSTPALLEICTTDSNFGIKLLPRLEKIILAGEVLTKSLVSSLKESFANIEVINGYGPTEGTVLLSACKITDEMLKSEKSLPIGEIFPKLEYRIEGADGSHCKDGEKGELVVIGANISCGYYNDYEKSKAAFFQEDGVNGYRTGDLVYEADGILYFLGRIDSQIKLNGFRIELSDISSNINKIEFVDNNVVMPIYNEGKAEYIAAFVSLNEGALGIKRPAMEIKRRLRAVLPSYMVPRKVIEVDSFPMNTSGKIDQKKLIEEWL